MHDNVLLPSLSRKHEVYVIYPTDRDNPASARDPFHHRPFPYPFRTYPMAQVHGTDLLNVFRLYARLKNEMDSVRREHGVEHGLLGNPQRFHLLADLPRYAVYYRPGRRG